MAESRALFHHLRDVIGVETLQDLEGLLPQRCSMCAEIYELLFDKEVTPKFVVAKREAGDV